MKELGIFGLAIPEPYGDARCRTPCYALVTEELARGWMSLAGAMGGHTVVAKLLLGLRHRGAEGPLPAPDGDRRDPRDHGADRARRRLRPPGHAHRRSPRRRRLRGQRLEDLDHQRPPLRPRRAAVQDRPGRRPGAPGHQHPAGGEGTRASTVSRDLPKLGYKGVESCELSFDDFRVPADAAARRGGGQGVRPDDARARDRPHPGRGPGARRRAGRVRGLAALRAGARDASASRSGSTSRSATTSPTWRPSSPPPAS